MEQFKNWEDDLYEKTFDEMYDSLVAQYKNGEISKDELERNVKEQQVILLNSFHEGEKKSIYNNAVIDAYQFVLSLISKGTLKVEKN